ncbi:uncharacterized protein [Choristoneura fumiferana]|uniref:uncharacterized protein n=1 Tax=Choristoneura fumiferana TaxID=7141 RepID=UPI003D154796
MEKTKVPSDELITTSTAKQLEADDALTELEAILVIHTTEKSAFQTHHSKLPTLPPPKFSGDILQFHQFWDKFQATIDKRNLDDVDKLSYLMASLEGKALEAVNGLDISNKNYAIAVEALQRQFGNKDHLIDAHHEALKDLVPALNQDDCRHTLNSIEHHLRVLETLGEDVNGNHLRTTIKSKFPDQTLYELNMALDPTQNTVPEIRKTLNRIITASERTRQPTPTVSFKPPISSTAVLQVEHKVSRGNNKRQQISNNYKRKNPDSSGPVKKRSKPSCIFCNEAHYNNECTKFKTVVDRKNKLGKRCFRCFRMGHFVSNCKWKKSCYNCKGDHHQALCPKTNCNGDPTKQKE